MIMGLLTLCVHESHGISFVHGHEQIGHVCLSMRVPTQLKTYLEPNQISSQSERKVGSKLLNLERLGHSSTSLGRIKSL